MTQAKKKNSFLFVAFRNSTFARFKNQQIQENGMKTPYSQM